MQYAKLHTGADDKSRSAAYVLAMDALVQIDDGTKRYDVLEQHVVDAIALEPARTAGDPQLVEHLGANVVANAVRRNGPGGGLDIAACTTAGRSVLTVANTGPVISTGELARRFEHCQRSSSHAGAASDGVGLGLAIVQAIVDAHDATRTAPASTGGRSRHRRGFPALD